MKSLRIGIIKSSVLPFVEQRYRLLLLPDIDLNQEVCCQSAMFEYLLGILNPADYCAECLCGLAEAVCDHVPLQ